MVFVAPNNYPKNADGFTPPAFGGTEALVFATIAYTDTTAKSLFTLPQGAVVTGIVVDVTTAFNDGGTDLLDIGITGTGAYYVNDLSVASVGQPAVTVVAGRLFATALTEPTVVTATYIPGTPDASAGVATIAFRYIVR